MPLLSLPTEILGDIFSRCEINHITETCRDFAAIVHSLQPLWSHTQLRQSQLTSADAPKFLRWRLERAGTLPLKVSVGPVPKDAASSPVVTEVCQTLSDFNLRISKLEISTETSVDAGTILSGIFSDSHSVYPGLQSLSIRLPEDEDLGFLPGAPWPQLDTVLKCAPKWFPMLESLAIPSFDDCVPIFPESTSFMHLRTLVLDGSLEQIQGTIGLLVGVLWGTPNLETLWVKHFSPEQVARFDRPSFGVIKGREIRSPVRLPRLTTLSVAVPGCGADLLYCLEAPVLETLHLDGSRGPLNGETEPDDTPWIEWSAGSVHGALKCIASNTRGLRRLALTSIYLTHVNWQWLLFGDGQGPPFPELESLALHGTEEFSGEIECGFDDDLLLQYSSTSAISLRRLVILRCNLPLNGSAFMQAFGRTIGGRKTLCELEYDTSCPQLTEDELNTLGSHGVRVIRRSVQESKEVEWWTQGHEVDVTDSYAH